MQSRYDAVMYEERWWFGQKGLSNGRMEGSSGVCTFFEVYYFLNLHALSNNLYS